MSNFKEPFLETFKSFFTTAVMYIKARGKHTEKHTDNLKDL